MNSEFEIKHHEDFGNHHESSRISIWTRHESWCRITKIDENITNLGTRTTDLQNEFHFDPENGTFID